MAEVAEVKPVVVAPVAHEEVFAVAHIFASFNDTFVVSILYLRMLALTLTLS